MDIKFRLGPYGEDLAESFLRRNGYRIIQRNFSIKLGEIDIIAKDKDTTCFIEVKTRRTDSHGSPFEAVSRRKQLKLGRVAACYIKRGNLENTPVRFDVVAVVIDEEDNNKIEIVKNAFALNGIMHI